MNLAELQCLLARLVTEPDLRERFLDDPAQVAQTQGWDTEPARMLSMIPASGLRHYGDALVSKRCREAARCLPLTHRALGDALFRKLFGAHAAGTTIQGPLRHRDDAVAFAEALGGGADLPDALSWVMDLAAYEATPLRCAEPGRRC